MKSKVLLIDDSVTIHRVIDLSIDVDRYDIVKVFSKEDAALKMQAEQYDYILLDNKLDNIIIIEYIKELKKAQPSASIILLVGAFDRFDENDLEKTGANDYLVKPFDSQSLNEKLSSDADMMPAGIVEKIAEADFARDNDNYISSTASLTTGEVIDGISKKEYLDNLEEVQPDDLTDNGYIEDFDNTTPSETNKEENAVEDEDTNTLEEESLPEIEEQDNNIEEATLSSDDIAQEEPSVINEPVVEDIKEEKEEMDNIENEELTTESSSNEDETITETQDIVSEEDNAAADSIMQDNLSTIDNSGEEMLDEFPDFPDIDDASTDELQDNIENEPIQENYSEENNDLNVLSVDNQVDDSPIDNAEELPAETKESETILVDDDNWLDDAPSTQEQSSDDNMQIEQADTEAIENEEINNIDHQEEVIEETPLLDNTEDNAVIENNEEINEDDSIIEENNTITDLNKDETETQDIQQVPDMPTDDIVADTKEEIEDIGLVQEEITAETNIEEDDSIVNDDMPNALEAENAPITSEVNDETLNEEIVLNDNEAQEVEELEEPVLEDNDIMPEQENKAQEETFEDEVAEETKEDINVVEQLEPVVAEQQQSLAPEKQPDTNDVKQAETYNPDTTGRFGGITVTISRDEIMAMLGNAIDKYFLEEAVKEVIATNMKEIVRNIVPSIAEKYIKEEIERLKNDE